MPRGESTVFEIPSPTTQSELATALTALHEEIGAYMASFSTAAFFAPQGEAWPPATHVRHLTKSIRPLARAMGLPRPVLWLRFGPARRPSRSFEEMRDFYRGRLAEGIQAGRYTPSPQRKDGLSAEDWQAQILDYFKIAGRDLDKALARWKERALDRYRLPHPALGKLTVREMLYFTLYHNHHHASRVREREALAATA